MKKFTMGPANTIEIDEDGKEPTFISKEDIARVLGEELAKDGESWDQALGKALGCTVIPEDRPEELRS